jgi:hypothetical protein
MAATFHILPNSLFNSQTYYRRCYPNYSKHVVNMDVCSRNVLNMKQSGSVQSTQTCQYYPFFLYVAVRLFSVVIIITINVKLKIIMINKEWYFWQEKGLSSGRRRQRQTVALTTYTAEWRMLVSPSGESTPRRRDWRASVVVWLATGAAEEHNATSPWSVRWYWNRFEYSTNGWKR